MSKDIIWVVTDCNCSIPGYQEAVVATFVFNEDAVAYSLASPTRKYYGFKSTEAPKIGLTDLEEWV